MMSVTMLIILLAIVMFAILFGGQWFKNDK